tara:strand:- start:99 stop:227 length:129 start_codon:yes stop_codon:yes gene_type:complete
MPNCFDKDQAAQARGLQPVGFGDTTQFVLSAAANLSHLNEID